MQIRLECYDHEKDAAMAGLSAAFRVKSISKGYPNVRQTGCEGTPCESRYYVKLEDDWLKQSPGLMELLTMDMLRYLSMLQTAYGLDTQPETDKLRHFYEAAPNLTDAQKFELLSEWKASLLMKCTAAGKEGI